MKINLVNQLEGFVATLNSAQESIDDRIVFERCTGVDLTQLNSAADYMSAAANSDCVNAMEKTMKSWTREMEQVMSETR